MNEGAHPQTHARAHKPRYTNQCCGCSLLLFFGGGGGGGVQFNVLAIGDER